MSNTTIRELKRQVSHVWGNPHNNDNYPWEQTRKCLHTRCRMQALPGTVYGLAFCELHLDRAQEVLGWQKDRFFQQPAEE